jgi:hypothetical protein
MSLALTIEARDQTTSGHCERLARYAVALGQAVGLNADAISALKRGGFLHDVGKVGIPDAVLLKPGPLTDNERALIRQHTVTPLAVGEVFNTVFDCQTLITEQLIDYIRTTVVHAGGITHLRRIAHLAELYQVRTGSRGATDLSPVCMGAALHFDTWVHNFGVQEYMRHTPETDAVFPHAYWFDDGYLHPGTAPGHGVDIDEALAARYPYKPSALPVNRLEDGTLWNW